MTYRRITLSLFTALLAGATMLAAAPRVSAQPGAITLTHVHGLAYSPDGKALMVANHHGLAVYSNGKWANGPGPRHDYMGFTATRSHLYSSGHPANGAPGFVDPLGLIRSKDGGRSWEKLGLEGETDFHLLATGWNTNAIYVWNPEPSSRMAQPGLHYTLNNGFQWHRVTAAGLSGKPHALVAHPDDPKTVALASSTGIHFSRDSGATFKPLANGEQGFSALFDLDGKHLWYGSFASAAKLSRVDIQNGRAMSVSLPAIGRDAVAYIAQNPGNPREYAIATLEKHIYVTPDEGKSWRQIVNSGRTL